MHLSNLPFTKWKCHWEPAEDAATCLPEKLVVTFTRPRFKLPFKMHWAVTGSAAHPECQLAKLWPHLCPQLVTDIPNCSAYRDVTTAQETDIFYQQSRTGTAKGSLCKQCPEGQNGKTALTLSCRWVLNVRSFFSDPCLRLNAVRETVSVWPVHSGHSIWRKYKMHISIKIHVFVV